MKRLALSFLIAFTSLFTAAGATLAANETPTFTVASVPASGDNEEPFWESYLATNYGGTWDCTKHNLTTDPVVLAQGVDALIIKAGTNNYGWVPAPAGDYSPPENSTSHYFTCDRAGETRDINPAGDIGGPCADPAYYGIFDNTGSDMTIRFRFRWYTGSGLHTVVKDVPAGAIYRTWEHWVKPFTLIRVGYRHPDTGVWINLASEMSVKGMYPRCVYKHGWDYPAG